MKIEPLWHRIGAIHVERDGSMGAVWLALDRDADVLRLYDAVIFRGVQSVPAVVAEGMAARGREYPIAFRREDSAQAELLDEHGINMLPEPVIETQSAAEVMNKVIWQRMMSSRFRVNAALMSWRGERKNFMEEKGLIPMEGFPLMSATRHAVRSLDWARPEIMIRKSQKNSPGIKVL